jgi:hypothetical protein
MKYRAVTATELIATLGTQCSPCRRSPSPGYVIGPDINGRLCHCATCSTLGEAQAKVDKLNKGEPTK